MQLNTLTQFTAVHTSRSLRAPIQGQFWKLQNTCSFRISLLQALSGNVPSWVISSLSRGQTGWHRFKTGSKQSRQNRWPHSVCTGWRIAKRHIGHSCRLRRGCLKLASKPSIPARQVSFQFNENKLKNCIRKDSQLASCMILELLCWIHQQWSVHTHTHNYYHLRQSVPYPYLASRPAVGYLKERLVKFQCSTRSSWVSVL